MSIRRLAAMTMTLALVIGGAAMATTHTKHYKGHPVGDKKADVSFSVKGKTVENISITNTHFQCYKANGSPAPLSGRTTYPFSFIQNAHVRKNKRFGGTYKNVAQHHTIEIYKFSGRLLRHGKAKGTFFNKTSEGGIDTGYCTAGKDKSGKRKWTAHT